MSNFLKTGSAENPIKLNRFFGETSLLVECLKCKSGMIPAPLDLFRFLPGCVVEVFLECPGCGFVGYLKIKLCGRYILKKQTILNEVED